MYKEERGKTFKHKTFHLNDLSKLELQLPFATNMHAVSTLSHINYEPVLFWLFCGSSELDGLWIFLPNDSWQGHQPLTRTIRYGPYHTTHMSNIWIDLLWWFSDRRIFEQDIVQMMIKTWTRSLIEHSSDPWIDRDSRTVNGSDRPTSW